MILLWWDTSWWGWRLVLQPFGLVTSEIKRAFDWSKVRRLSCCIRTTTSGWQRIAVLSEEKENDWKGMGGGTQNFYIWEVRAKARTGCHYVMCKRIALVLPLCFPNEAPELYHSWGFTLKLPRLVVCLTITSVSTAPQKDVCTAL